MTDNITDDLNFEDVTRRLTIDGDNAVVRRQQDISDAFWDQVKNVKHVQDHAPIGDFHQVASIPCVLVEKWFAEGFNMFDPNVSIQDVLKRLRAEDATDLITTSRTI
jgi:hypothetical protein